jgi:hypothetical protein
VLSLLAAAALAAPPTLPPLDQRIRDAIAQTRHMTVVYTDPLGEGGGLDADPRVPKAEVDCMTWVQWVLALALGAPESAADRMDRLRYYGGVVDFRSRKHYLDRWLAWEPGPVRALDLSTHPAKRTHQVSIEPVLLRADRGAPCPLWREDLVTFRVDYLGADTLLADAAAWAPGWYLLTGVAQQKYLDMFGEKSGPMGQVHLFLLDATEAGRAGKPPSEWTLWHASTLRGAVFEDSLGRLTGHTRTIYRGFVPYALTDALGPPAGVGLAACPSG